MQPEPNEMDLKLHLISALVYSGFKGLE